MYLRNSVTNKSVDSGILNPSSAWVILYKRLTSLILSLSTCEMGINTTHHFLGLLWVLRDYLIHTLSTGKPL